MFPYAETVQVLTGVAATDPYSGEATGLDWSTPTERDELCAVADGGSTEPLQDARNSIVSDFDLIFDHNPEVSPAERVRVRGLICDVVGRPFLWRSPFTGWEPGTVVRVKVVEG